MNRIKDDHQHDRPRQNAKEWSQHEPAQIKRARGCHEHREPASLVYSVFHSHKKAQKGTTV
jgi:hypothetical protein